jgi:hypothetical protein
MTRKEAMEWAGKYIRSGKVGTINDCMNELADLFQEATKGLYRLGQGVEVEWVDGEWENAQILAEINVSGTSHRFVTSRFVRPIREKRQATREEKILALRGGHNTEPKIWLFANNTVEIAKVADSTIDDLCRCAGIPTEVEADE